MIKYLQWTIAAVLMGKIAFDLLAIVTTLTLAAALKLAEHGHFTNLLVPILFSKVTK